MNEIALLALVLVIVLLTLGWIMVLRPSKPKGGGEKAYEQEVTVWEVGGHLVKIIRNVEASLLHVFVDGRVAASWSDYNPTAEDIAEAVRAVGVDTSQPWVLRDTDQTAGGGVCCIG